MKLKHKDFSVRPMSIPRNSNMRESKSDICPKLTYFIYRGYLIGEDQYKQSQAEFNQMKEKIKKMIPSKEEEHKKEVYKLHTQHVLANHKVRLNDTIGQNRSLKGEIDIMRKEIV